MRKKKSPRHQSIKNKIEKAIQVSRRNEYSLMLMDQINELQIYPSGLLLLLEKYDNSSTPSARQLARNQVNDYVNKFSEIRRKFEDIFSRTRILNNPIGYILDQNRHGHLANASNTSDWMYVYELAMNRKIYSWLGNSYY